MQTTETIICPECLRALRLQGSKIPRHGDRNINAVPRHAVGGYRTRPCSGSGMAATVKNAYPAPDCSAGGDA